MSSSAHPDWQTSAMLLLAHVGDPSVRTPRHIGPADLAQLARKGIDSLYYVAHEPLAYRQRLYDTVWQVQRNALAEMSERLGGRGIPFALLKGADAALRWYGAHSVGAMNDIDMLIQPSEAAEVGRLFRSVGFRQARVDMVTGTLQELTAADLTIHSQRSNTLYEFVRLESLQVPTGGSPEPLPGVVATIEGTTRCLVRFDVHVGGPRYTHPTWNFDNMGVWGRLIQTDASPGLSLSDADAVWYVLAKLYEEVTLSHKQSLRDFAYVLPAITKGDPDWERLVSVVERWTIFADVYYYLRFLNVLVPGAVPANVLEACDPSRRPDVLHRRHWGWQLWRPFDLDEPLPSEIVRRLPALASARSVVKGPE